MRCRLPDKASYIPPRTTAARTLPLKDPCHAHVLTGAGAGGGAGGVSFSGTAKRTLDVRSRPPSDISAAISLGLCSTVSSTLALKCALCAWPTCMVPLARLFPVFRMDSGERATDSSLASPVTDCAVEHAALDLTRSCCCGSSSCSCELGEASFAGCGAGCHDGCGRPRCCTTLPLGRACSAAAPPAGCAGVCMPSVELHWPCANASHAGPLVTVAPLVATSTRLGAVGSSPFDAPSVRYSIDAMRNSCALCRPLRPST